MAIKVIAQRRELKIGNKPGKRFVMRPDLYVPIAEKKVFAEAATHSGISSGVIKAAWDAAGEVIRTWATEGHSVPLPGLGTMRFGVRSKSVENLEDVKTGLITTRRIVFTPNTEVKDELKNTSIQITCLDEDGNVLKRVTISGKTSFSDSTMVSLSGPDGADIYYTLDGSTPTSESTMYTEEFGLSETTTVKAVAIKDGQSSQVVSKIFTKG